MTAIFWRRSLPPIAVLVLAALLAGCSSSDERDGKSLPATEVSAVRTQVEAAMRASHDRLGIAVAISELGGKPRTRAALQKLGFVDPPAGAARAYTPAAFAAGRRLDGQTIAFDLASERFAGIRNVTVTTPGLGQAGARLYVVEIRVSPLPSPVAQMLARAGAIECADLGGERTPLAEGATVPALYYTSYDPALPNADQVRAGLAHAIRPGCPLLR